MRKKIRVYQEAELKTLAVNARVEAFNIEIASKAAKILRLKEIINKNEKKINMLLYNIEEANSEKNEALKLINNSNQNFERKINQLEQENNLHFQEINHMKTKNTILVNENKKISKSYSLVQESLDKSGQELETLRIKCNKNTEFEQHYIETLRKKDEDIEKYQKIITENQSDISDLTKKISTLQSSYEIVVNSLKENTKKFEELYKAHESLKLLGSYEDKFNEQKTENLELQKKIIQNNEKFQELEQKAENLSNYNDKLIVEIGLLKLKVNEM